MIDIDALAEHCKFKFPEGIRDEYACTRDQLAHFADLVLVQAQSACAALTPAHRTYTMGNWSSPEVKAK